MQRKGPNADGDGMGRTEVGEMPAWGHGVRPRYFLFLVSLLFSFFPFLISLVGYKKGMEIIHMMKDFRTPVERAVSRDAMSVEIYFSLRAFQECPRL